MIVDGERVKAILGIKGATKYGKTRNYSTRMAYEIVDAIDDSVIPESELQREQNRPKGKWEVTSTFPRTWICSNCGTHYEERLTFKAHNYCCVCGAEMEKEE